MKALLEHIKQYAQLNESALEALSGALHKKEFTKGSYLITEGKVCDHVHFIEEGCFRGFYDHDGKEISYWFAFENDFVHRFIVLLAGSHV